MGSETYSVVVGGNEQIVHEFMNSCLDIRNVLGIILSAQLLFLLQANSLEGQSILQI